MELIKGKNQDKMDWRHTFSQCISQPIRLSNLPRSRVKEDCAADAVSKLEMRVMMRSVRPMTAFVQGRNDPMCARYTSSPTCFRYTLFPLLLGPVISETFLSPLQKVSLGTKAPEGVQ